MSLRIEGEREGRVYASNSNPTLPHHFFCKGESLNVVKFDSSDPSDQPCQIFYTIAIWFSNKSTCIKPFSKLSVQIKIIFPSKGVFDPNEPLHCRLYSSTLPCWRLRRTERESVHHCFLSMRSQNKINIKKQTNTQTKNE